MIRASVADLDGEIVGTDSAGIHWEGEMLPGRLTSFIARCSEGAELEVRTPVELFHALARRWWVWPQSGSIRVRLLLERHLPG